MYEEYQRQEEENIKKGKKGLVSTISGLSAQTSGIKSVMEMKEMNDTSQTPESETEYESAESRNLLSDRRGPEESFKGPDGTVGGVRVEVHDLLVDIKAEKVEATEVKLDDADFPCETLGISENGALVEVDSLLDNVYCTAVEKLNNNVSCMLLPKSNMDDQDATPLISLDDGEGVLHSNNFLFPKAKGSMEDKLIPDLSSDEALMLQRSEMPSHSRPDNELCLLSNVTNSTLPDVPVKGEKQLLLEGISFLTATEPNNLTEVPEVVDTPEVNRLTENTSSRSDTTINTSDSGKLENGKDKEKIRTTSTTQVSITLTVMMLRLQQVYDVCLAYDVHI